MQAPSQLVAAPKLRAIEKSPTLEIGDPAGKDKQADLLLDAIIDTRTGELLSPAETAARLAGESHTDINFHRAQLRIIEELPAARREDQGHSTGSGCRQEEESGPESGRGQTEDMGSLERTRQQQQRQQGQELVRRGPGWDEEPGNRRRGSVAAVALGYIN